MAAAHETSRPSSKPADRNRQGLVEQPLEIPDGMPHFVRQSV
jgi:hypothetical protein